METATMPDIYHPLFIILVGTVCSAILTVWFAWFIGKKGWNAVPFVMIFLAVSWVLTIQLVVHFGYPLQAAIAVPYIQAALDEETECDGYDYLADARGFLYESESGYRWASEDHRANCGYNSYNGLWRCHCLPQKSCDKEA